MEFEGFEWDESKNNENILNHNGISFEKAIKAFEDPQAIPLANVEHSTEMKLVML